MYDAKFQIATSQQRSQERTSKSKSRDAKESELTKNSSNKINLNDEKALLRYFKADKKPTSNNSLTKTQKQI